jgi:hypothetical protein
MSVSAPFLPTGPVQAIAVTVAASTAVQTTSSSGFTTSSGNNAVLTNVGSVPVQVGWGSSAAVAQALCASFVATGAATGSANTFILLPNSQVTISVGPGSFYSTICASGTATLYVQPGDGI